MNNSWPDAGNPGNPDPSNLPIPPTPEQMGKRLLQELNKWSGDCDDAFAISLIRSGAALETKNKRGDVALILAAINGHTDVALELIRSGAKIDARGDADGRTALNWAATQGNLVLLKALIAKGADIFEKDNSGKTALEKATEFNATAVVQFLKPLSDLQQQQREEKIKTDEAAKRDSVRKYLKEKAPKNPFGGPKP